MNKKTILMGLIVMMIAGNKVFAGLDNAPNLVQAAQRFYASSRDQNLRDQFWLSQALRKRYPLMVEALASLAFENVRTELENTGMCNLEKEVALMFFMAAPEQFRNDHSVLFARLIQGIGQELEKEQGVLIRRLAQHAIQRSEINDAVFRARSSHQDLTPPAQNLSGFNSPRAEAEAGSAEPSLCTIL